VGLRAAARAAAITLLDGYAAAQVPPVKLQTYPGRPRSINPPTAFVDRIAEVIDYEGTALGHRTADVDVVLLHGLMDTKDAVDQADAFVDGFLAYVDVNIHAAGGNRTFGGASADDEPNYVPEWQDPAVQRVHFATRITLQGFQGGFD
jgi:hypothetical protein